MDTKGIEPQWNNILVTRHAMRRYQHRVAESPTGENNVLRKLKYVLLEGRRSDRDSSLVREIEPWLRFVKWKHCGRPVTLFMNERSRVCCLVVADQEKEDGLVILTCFKAA